MTAENKPLAGLRVLVPRGGAWGELVSRALREKGATPVVSPLVDFAYTSEEDRLIDALKRLEAGEFDWMTATSGTVVSVLAHHGVVIHKRTQVALVGEATVASFIEAGYEVSRTPDESNNTTAGLLEVWPEIDTGEVLKVLTLRSNVAKPVLTDGLIERGHDVTQVAAFRTVGVPASVHTAEDVHSGRINALLVASPMIAREVSAQFGDRPKDTLIACVGDRAREEAEAAGLCASPGASDPRVEALIKAVESVIDQSDMLD